MPRPDLNCSSIDSASRILDEGYSHFLYKTPVSKRFGQAPGLNGREVWLKPVVDPATLFVRLS